MALKNKDENYLKVINYNNDFVQVNIYKDEIARLDGIGTFDNMKIDVVHVDNLKDCLNVPADPNKSIYDNLISTLYLKVKENTEYADWEDC